MGDVTDSEFSAWIGRTETVTDDLSPAAAAGVAALLDDATTPIEPEAPLPPLWQWFYFLPRAAQSELDADGHPRRGGFLPPIPLPRRMFAGARMRFERPLRLGVPATRTGEIVSVATKPGRSGPLAFVTVRYSFTCAGELCLTEEQDIVYRGPTAAVPAPVAGVRPPAPQGAWVRSVTPDTRLLFRFSALTFNAHRIHYDRGYASDVEGYPGLVVHGPLTALLLAEMVRRRTDRRLSAFSFRGVAPLFDLAPFHLLGRPAGDQVQLTAYAPDATVAMTAQGELARTGTA